MRGDGKAKGQCVGVYWKERMEYGCDDWVMLEKKWGWSSFSRDRMCGAYQEGFIDFIHDFRLCSIDAFV